MQDLRSTMTLGDFKRKSHTHVASKSKPLEQLLRTTSSDSGFSDNASDIALTPCDQNENIMPVKSVSKDHTPNKSGTFPSPCVTVSIGDNQEPCGSFGIRTGDTDRAITVLCEQIWRLSQQPRGANACEVARLSNNAPSSSSRKNKVDLEKSANSIEKKAILKPGSCKKEISGKHYLPELPSTASYNRKHHRIKENQPGLKQTEPQRDAGDRIPRLGISQLGIVQKATQPHAKLQYAKPAVSSVTTQKARPAQVASLNAVILTNNKGQSSDGWWKQEFPPKSAKRAPRNLSS